MKFNSFSEFFTTVSDGEFGMGALADTVVDLNDNVLANPDMSALKSLSDALGVVMPFVMIGVMIFIAFFGKKILPLLSFISFFFIGFALGVCYTAPALSTIISLPAWISGLVVGILCAIFYRLLYFATFVGGICIFSYTLCYALIPVGALALIFAVVVLLFAFIFKKFVEMFASSVIAAWAVTSLIQNNIFDYANSDFFADIAWIVTALIVFVIALPGLVVQVKTRRRY